MKRRDLFKAITGLTAVSPTYITAQDTVGVEALILTCPRGLTVEQAERLRATWTQGVKGTVLEHLRLIVLGDGMSVELMRSRQP